MTTYMYICINFVYVVVQCYAWYQILGAFFWGYSGYSYSGLGITEYTEFQLQEKNAPTCFRSGNGIGGDLRTTISAAV